MSDGPEKPAPAPWWAHGIFLAVGVVWVAALAAGCIPAA